LLRNEGGNQNNLLRVKTAGVVSNRDGIGAKVKVEITGGVTLWSFVKTGSSYCSQSEMPITFGLGKANKVARLEVAWPSGKVDVISGLDANQEVTIKEGSGLVFAQPIVFERP
jgi:hypothetical protein